MNRVLNKLPDVEVTKTYCRPRRVFVAGDSNCLAFKDLLTTVPGTDENAFFYTTYISGLRASEVWTSAGGLSPGILSILSTYALLDHTGEPTHLSLQTDVQANIFAAGQPLTAPVLLIIVGDIDLRNKICPLLKGPFDFVLSDDSEYDVESGSSILPRELIEEQLKSIVASLVRGAVELQERYGLRVVLHAVNPPTLDEDRFSGIMKFSLPALKRYKIVSLYNELLKNACEDANVGYISIWKYCTEDGYLRQEFELDGVHLAPETVAFTIKELFGFVTSAVHKKTNYVRYSMVMPRAARRLKAIPSITDATDEKPICTDDSSIWCIPSLDDFTEIAQSIFALPGVAAEEVTCAFDWVDALKLPIDTRFTSIPSELLGALQEKLCVDNYNDVFRASVGADYILVGCRGLKLPETGTDAVFSLRAPAPKVVCKGLIAIDLTEAQIFSAAGQLIERLVLQPNSCLLYRPSAVSISIHYGSRRFIEFTVLPRLAGQRFCLLSSALGDWPADPFHYSLNGLSAFPISEKPSFSALSLSFVDEIRGEVTSDYTKEGVKAEQSHAVADTSSFDLILKRNVFRNWASSVRFYAAKLVSLGTSNRDRSDRRNRK